MRKSHIAMLGALVFMLLTIVGIVAGLRFTVSSFFDGSVARAQTPAAVDDEDAVSSELNLTGFSEVLVRDAWQIDISEGDSWSVELSYPDERENDLDISVSNGVLVLDADEPSVRSWFGWGARHRSMTARIVMPTLSAIEVQGSADIDIAGFDGDSLALDISGAANVEGRDSEYADLDLRISGASNVDFHDVATENAVVDLSGAMMVRLRMDGGTLSGQISGFGNLTYAGDVTNEDVRVTGFSRVSQGF